MNYCFHCGKKLSRLKTASGWVGRFRCDAPGCGQRYQLTYGDGGKTSSDVFHFCGNRPFDTETLEPVATEDFSFE